MHLLHIPLSFFFFILYKPFFVYDYMEVANYIM